jgi:predicted TPR repeat methyltransferase
MKKTNNNRFDHGTRNGRRISIDQAIRVAMEFQQQSKLEQAEGIYREVLKAVPNHPDALHFLGVLHYQHGRTEKAIETITQALKESPDYMDAHNNLGNIYMETGCLKEAEGEYRQTVELAPKHVGALNNLATVLRAMGRLDESEAIFRDALEGNPNFYPLHYNLGTLLFQNGQEEEAVEHFFKAVVLDPSQAHSKVRLGLALITLGRKKEAEDLYRSWLQKEPDNPEARHLLAACTGDAIPGKASDGYVKSLFDRFADSFEEQLNILEYKAPELVAEAVAKSCGKPEGRLVILDAGCGTGLCGHLLKPFALRLDGVDLSSGMLKKASAAGIYDQLTEADLTAYIRGQDSVYDAIVAADVLCYFGDLQDVFAAAANAIKPGGRFIFSVERCDPSTARDNGDYRIIPQGRYTHTESYLRRVAVQQGWVPESIDHQILRKEMGLPVDGLVVTLARA